jgi:hypothetical protein
MVDIFVVLGQPSPEVDDLVKAEWSPKPGLVDEVVDAFAVRKKPKETESSGDIDREVKVVRCAEFGGLIWIFAGFLHPFNHVLESLGLALFWGYLKVLASIRVRGIAEIFANCAFGAEEIEELFRNVVGVHFFGFLVDDGEPFAVVHSRNGRGARVVEPVTDSVNES